MFAIDEIISMIIQSSIFSYCLFYIVTKNEKKSYLLFVLFSILFTINRSIYYFSIPAQSYFFFSQIAISIVYIFVLKRKIDFNDLIIILILNMIYTCAIYLSFIMQNGFYSLNIYIPNIFASLLSEVILMGMSVYIVDHYHFIPTSMNQKILFVCTFICLLFILTIISQLFSIDNTLHPQLYLLILVLSLLTLFTTMLFIKLNESQRDYYEESLINQELKTKEKTYHQIQHSIDNLSHLRHDMSYMLMHIKNMNDNQEIEDYINQQLDHIHYTQNPIITKNQTLDYILFENQSTIQSHQIDIVIQNKTEDFPMNKTDTYTLFSIIIENIIHHNHNIQTSIIIDDPNDMICFKVLYPGKSDCFDQHDLKIINNILSKYNSSLIIDQQQSTTIISFFIDKETSKA